MRRITAIFIGFAFVPFVAFADDMGSETIVIERDTIVIEEAVSAPPPAFVELQRTAIAAGLWWWERLYKVLDPYLVVANAMPKTAFVPIFYLWLGASRGLGAALGISAFVITALMLAWLLNEVRNV